MVEGEVQNYIPSIDSKLTIVENTINPMLTETFCTSEKKGPLVETAGISLLCIYWFNPPLLGGIYYALQRY